MSFDAIVLCGGSARRLGGTDKASVVVGGISLLDRALDAVAIAEHVLVVGPRRPTVPEVTWTMEDPPGGGPVTGIAAGLDLVDESIVMVLGVDFPMVDRACVQRLVGGVSVHDGLALRDETGRAQFLIGAYRGDALARALVGRDPRGMPVSELVEELDVVVVDHPRATIDCDTWEDVARVEELLRTERA